MLALRILPPIVRTSRRPQRMIERSFMEYRRAWIIVVSGFFEPLFYLLSVRVGMGRLVGTVTVGGHPVRYVEFVAPALLAASSMNGAVYDSTSNVFDKIKYTGLYATVLATPMTVADIALGEIGWAMIRGQLYAVAFLVTLPLLGLATHGGCCWPCRSACSSGWRSRRSAWRVPPSCGAGPTSTRSSW